MAKAKEFQDNSPNKMNGYLPIDILCANIIFYQLLLGLRRLKKIRNRTMQGLHVQAFLDFRSFNFRDFQFNAVYNSIIFSFPLVLLSNLDLRGFRFPRFFMCPHINSINRGMPVPSSYIPKPRSSCGSN